VEVAGTGGHGRGVGRGPPRACALCCCPTPTRRTCGPGPLVDGTARRRALTGLRRCPVRLLQNAGLVGTDPRRRNGAAWLRADLAHAHPWDAPAWDGTDATPNQREVYRRFVRSDLPRLEAPLRAWGVELLGGQVAVVAAAELARPSRLCLSARIVDVR